MAAEAAGDEAAPASRPPALTFLDLPAETQQEIISHCAQSDLICVALVSKRFHELASAQLYRSFNILFPDGDDLRFDSPIDGLAGGLDTFTTSEYNYAKHLKELSMDSVSTGVKAEHAYKAYLYNTSCGKFLNTLLALALRNAKSLETFRWNIRVELSRPVYRELHKIQTLSTFHIRMQSGDSYYVTPPPLPLLPDDAPQQNHWADMPPSFSTSTSSLSTSKTKSKAGKCNHRTREPPTLSGFKKLKTLSVLDIDSLDIVTELKTCIRNSSATLKEFQISLSDSLALQARNTLAGDSDPDDSDADDEFQVDPASPGSNFDDSGPAKTFRSQEERKLQESILGRIFDAEPFIKKSPFQQSRRGTAVGSGKVDESESNNTTDSREVFVNSIKDVSTKLMSLNNGSRDFSATQQDILEMIEKAARKYVDSGDLPNKASEEGSSTGKQLETKKDGSGNHEDQPGQSERKESSGLLNTAGQSKGKGIDGDVSPDDIEIEHPDLADDIDEESDEQAAKESNDQPIESASHPITSTFHSPPTNPPSGVGQAVTNLTAQLHNPEILTTRLGLFQTQVNLLEQKIKDMFAAGDDINPSLIDEAEFQMRELHESIVDVQRQIKIAEAEMKDVTRQMQNHPKSASSEGRQRSMDDYIRDTRGLALETLSIYLVPVKASVLSRAIDLRCIKNLTLLNVGNQASIWTMLSRENKTRPLALRSVFTDNVSVAFLNCMSQLDELDELFMLERSPKHRPESFAPKSTVTIDQIRRLVLKKHMATLKRLLIKDESNGSNGSNWDVNPKAMILICTRGALLEELAVSMNIHAVHAFMQYFSGLVSLKAINIIHFRNNDTCIWVMRETLNFIVDNLSHHPELKLEWIAMEDDRLDRVIRPSQTARSGELSKKRNKGKGKATNMSHDTDALPMLSMSEWGSESETDEDEDNAFNCGKRLRLKTVGVLQFYEVWGIKIFDKEIRSGRL